MLNMKNTILSANVLHSPKKLLLDLKTHHLEMKTLLIAILVVVGTCLTVLISYIVSQTYAFNYDFRFKWGGITRKNKKSRAPVLEEGGGGKWVGPPV